MKILFVCKHNRFRSKVAEAIFKNLDRKNEVKSAGVVIDILRPYIVENVKKIMKTKGLEFENEQSREVNGQDLKWADIIVIVANNIDKDIFKDKTRAQVRVWDINDVDGEDYEGIKSVIGQIEIRVKKLVKTLN
jgi:protein-tyrosine-phosphatase